MKQLKKLLEDRGMTQRELAKTSGVSQGAISMIANGLRDPSWSIVCALADALGVSTDELRGDEDEAETNESSTDRSDDDALCA